MTFINFHGFLFLEACPLWQSSSLFFFLNMYLAGFSISVLPPPLQHTNDGDCQTFVEKSYKPMYMKTIKWNESHHQGPFAVQYHSITVLFYQDFCNRCRVCHIVLYVLTPTRPAALHLALHLHRLISSRQCRRYLAYICFAVTYMCSARPFCVWAPPSCVLL